MANKNSTDNTNANVADVNESFTTDLDTIVQEPTVAITLPSGHKAKLLGTLPIITTETVVELIGKQDEAVKLTAPKVVTKEGVKAIKSGLYKPGLLKAMIAKHYLKK